MIQKEIFIPAKCGVVSVIIFCRLKIYRAPNEKPRLYKLTQAELIYDDVLQKRLLNIKSHLVAYVGEATSERAYEVVACTVKDRDWVSALYEKYAEVSKKGIKEIFWNWWKRIYQEWILWGDAIIEESPSDFSTDPTKYTMGYADISQLSEGLHPSWDSFMSQMSESDKKVAMAFFWSIFEPENNGRQILYIYDRGLTGKSDVANTFFTKLPHASGPISTGTFKERFGYSAVFGHRLLIYPDCKVKDILVDEKICSISGGDSVLIEYKGLGAFMGRVYAKVIIMSNQAPKIDTYRIHNTSRLLPIHLDASKCISREHYDSEGNFIGSNEYIKKLKEEFWYFLYDCKKVYPEMCPSNREIVVKTKDRNEVVYEDMKSDHEVLFDSWMKDDFELSEDKQIYGFELYGYIRDALLPKENPYNRAIAIREFKIYLEEKYEIIPVFEDFTKNKRRIRRNIYKGIGKKISSEDFTKSDKKESTEEVSCLFTSDGKISGEGMDVQGL